MGEQEREEQFFKAKPREDSQIGKIPPPMSTPRKLIAGGVAAVALVALWIWHSAADVQATLWVHNPGPAIVHVFAAGKSDDVAPGQLFDVKVPVAKALRVHVGQADQKDNVVEVETHDDTKEVAVLDPGGAAYVVLDVSPLFREAAQVPQTFEITYRSPGAKSHHLPFNVLELIRPGREPPKKDSWEVQAFRSSSSARMFKVCRVDPARLAEPDKLAASLSQALKDGKITQAEDLHLIRTSSKSG